MKVKTSTLIGPALDWAVAQCEGHECSEQSNNPFMFKWHTGGLPHYSTDWAQGGPIIEQMGDFGFQLKTDNSSSNNQKWWASLDTPNGFYHGPTPLIAAMRCYVASKLGKEVDIPEELNE